MRQSGNSKLKENSDFFKPGNRSWGEPIRKHWLLLSVFSFVIVAFLVLQLDAFFTSRNLLNIARSFSWIAIAAFGESLVIIIGGIDLSVGAVMGLTGLISAFSIQAGLPVWLAILIGLSTGGLVGWVNGFVIGRVKLPPFIVTLATMSIARGATHGLSGGWSVTDLPWNFRFLGQSDLSSGAFSLPLPFIIMLVLALLVHLLMQKTLLGRYIYAEANNEKALVISGVNVFNVKILTYTLCGLLAATGGLLMTARLGVATPTAASGYELDIIVAAVIGGTSLFGGRGTIFGVLMGAALMQVLRNGLVLLGFPAYWQEAAMGVMILLAIMMDYWRQERAFPWRREKRSTVQKLPGKGVLAPLRRRRALSAVIVLIALAVFSLAVWQLFVQSPLISANSQDQQTLTIAWIPKALDNPVFELGRQGAVQKAAELSASGPVQVKILYVGSVSSEAAEQVRVMDDVISSGVDAIAISCIDPTACIDPINKAVAAGIPVMTWDSEFP